MESAFKLTVCVCVFIIWNKEIVYIEIRIYGRYLSMQKGEVARLHGRQL